MRLAPLWPLPPVATGTELLHAFELQSPAEYKVLHPLVKVSPPNPTSTSPYLPLTRTQIGPRTCPEPAQPQAHNLNPTTPRPHNPNPSASCQKVRREPAATATSLGFGLRKGATIRADAVSGAWVRIATSTSSNVSTVAVAKTVDPAAAYAGGWVLTDGAELGLGLLLQAVEAPTRRLPTPRAAKLLQASKVLQLCLSGLAQDDSLAQDAARANAASAPPPALEPQDNSWAQEAATATGTARMPTPPAPPAFQWPPSPQQPPADLSLSVVADGRRVKPVVSAQVSAAEKAAAEKAAAEKAVAEEAAEEEAARAAVARMEAARARAAAEVKAAVKEAVKAMAARVVVKAVAAVEAVEAAEAAGVAEGGDSDEEEEAAAEDYDTEEVAGGEAAAEGIEVLDLGILWRRELAMAAEAKAVKAAEGQALKAAEAAVAAEAGASQAEAQDVTGMAAVRVLLGRCRVDRCRWMDSR